jgi:hypothetical protein
MFLILLFATAMAMEVVEIEVIFFSFSFSSFSFFFFLFFQFVPARSDLSRVLQSPNFRRMLVEAMQVLFVELSSFHFFLCTLN